MRLLTVAGREFTSGARQPWTHRVRWMTASVFFGLLLWLLWVHEAQTRPGAGRQVFDSMAIITLFYSLFIAAARSADSISSEKREGTLGLLFLTELNSAEILAGKLVTNAVSTGYGLIAIFPLLALPILMGGIQFSHFGRLLLGLINGMWLATACAFAASVLVTSQVQAVGFALGSTLALALGFPLMAEGLREYHYPLEFCSVISSVSPLYCVRNADSAARMFGLNYFWQSLLGVHLLGWGLFSWAVWRLSKSWQDSDTRSASRRSGLNRTRSFDENGNEIEPPGVRGFRTRMLDLNPYFWLAARRRISSPVMLLICFISCLVCFLWIIPLLGRTIEPGSTLGHFIGQMFGCFLLGCFLHTLMAYYAGVCASQRLAEDKQAGALELVLCTPLKENRIFSGLWMAYARKLAGPGLIVLLVHFFLIWHVATAFVLENRPELTGNSKSAGQIILQALTSPAPASASQEQWAPIFLVRCVSAAMLVLVLNWMTIGLVGRWLGVRMKHAGLAPLASAAAVCIPPWILFGFLCFFLERLLRSGIPEQELFPAMLWVALACGGGHALALSLWAHERLRSHFRTLVVGRFDPVLNIRAWRPSRTLLVRTAIVILCIPPLIAGLLLLLTSRAKSNWNRVRTAFEGEKAAAPLEAFFTPPAEPAFNFARSAAMGKVRLMKQISQCNLASMWYHGTPNNLPLGWPQGQYSNYTNFLVAITGKPATRSSRTNAMQVMLALKEANPVLDELLPELLVKTNHQNSYRRDPGVVFGADANELIYLGNIAIFLQIRATAQLDLGNFSKASEDILGSFRLARLAANFPDASSTLVCQFILCQGIQPLWEGLADDAWSMPELEAFKKSLASFDLTDAYKRNLLRINRAFAESFNNLPEWQRPFSFWIYDRSSAVYTASGHSLQVIEKGFDGNYGSWANLTRIGLSNPAQYVIQQLQWWGLSPSLVSYAQTAVNEAIIACALQQHHARHGRYPDELQTLVPDYLAAVPLDSLRQRSFYYKPKGDSNFQLRGSGPNLLIEPVAVSSDDWVWTYPAMSDKPARSE